MSDETFDWRPPAARLASGWRTIAAAAVVGGALGLLLGLTDRARYESTVLLAVAKPEIVARFEARLAPADSNPSFPYQVATLRAYAELARSEAIARSVAVSLGRPDHDGARLLDHVAVEALADGSLLVLRSRGDSAAAAAELANAWAAALVDLSTDVFSARVGDDALASQLERAAADLREAEERLEAFHGDSGLPARETELEATNRRYGELLAATDRLASVRLDLATLRRQTERGTVADLGDRLAALVLQMSTLTAGVGLPVRLDVPGGGVDTGVSASDLDSLEAAAAAAAADLAEEAALVPEELDRLTAGVEALRTARGALDRERKLAEDRYVALARKVDETAVLRAVEGTELQIAAAAVPPVAASWARPARASLLSAAFGAVAGALLVLLRPDRTAGRGASERDAA